MSALRFLADWFLISVLVIGLWAAVMSTTKRSGS